MNSIIAWLIFFGFIACVLIVPSLVILHNMSDIDRQTLRDLPSAQPERRWTPCSERLPEETKCYLVCSAHGSAIGVDFYSTTNGKWAMWGEHVVAWQPLPEPYEESGADMCPST